MLVLSSDEVAAEGPLEVAVEDELSTEARELVSDLVGLPPTFGFCCGGLGGGALGLDGLVVAIEAGLFIEIFLADEIAPGAAVAPTGKSEGFTEEARPPPLPALLEGLWRLGIIGGGCGALFFLWLGDKSLLPPPVGLITLEVVVEVVVEAVVIVFVGGIVPFPLTLFITFELSFSNMSIITSLLSFSNWSTFAEVEEEVEAAVEAAAADAWAKLILGVVSVGVASAALQTGKKLPFISVDMLVCNIGPEMSNFLIGPRSGLGGGSFTAVGNVVGGSLLRTEEVGEERPLVMMVISSCLEAMELRSFFSDCDLLTSFDFKDFERLLLFFLLTT